MEIDSGGVDDTGESDNVCLAIEELDLLFLDELEDENAVVSSDVADSIVNGAHLDLESNVKNWLSQPLPTDTTVSTIAPSIAIVDANSIVVSVPGLRGTPDVDLVNAGRGEERLPSESNDRWAMRKADQLRAALKWDMSIALGDLPLEQMDLLLSNMFTRAVKVKSGTEYPSGTIMNLMNCYNRIIRRASDLRSISGRGDLVARDFNIKTHPLFAKTRMVVKAAVKKSAKDGVNKRRQKVENITEQMEQAILSDLDHQIIGNYGCQKRLAFYCMCRLGIRGGQELWDLRREDLRIDVDKNGREYVRFEERQSKNNSYSLDRYQEEQFRKLYSSYEIDFIVTLKQYLRHMPPLEEDTKPDLFMGPITNPTGNVWYNRKHKVSRERAGKWLSSMLTIVGLRGDMFTNKSGRVTLVTRMAALGVPDDVGMMITGHHSTHGYKRYDRTETLKMEAATVVSVDSNLSYQQALLDVSRNFMSEKIVGNSGGLKPLVERAAGTAKPISMTTMNQGSTGSEGLSNAAMKRAGAPINRVDFVDGKCQAVACLEGQGSNGSRGFCRTSDYRQQEAAYNQMYDEVNFDAFFANNPRIAKALGIGAYASQSIGSSIAGNSFTNCTVNFICSSKPSAEDKENDSNLQS